MKVRVRDVEGPRPGVCAYCRDALVLAEVLECAGCGAVLHTPCWGEVRECPSIGCAAGVPAGAKQAEGCISCQTPLPDGTSGACAACRGQHEQIWDEDAACACCHALIHPRGGAPCPGCNVVLHFECWGTQGRCSTPGCGRESPLLALPVDWAMDDPGPGLPQGTLRLAAMIVLGVLTFLALVGVLSPLFH